MRHCQLKFSYEETKLLMKDKQNKALQRNLCKVNQIYHEEVKSGITIQNKVTQTKLTIK